MALGRNVFGLSPQAKARLLEKVSAGGPKRAAARAADRAAAWDGNAGRLSVTELEGSKEIRMIREAAEFLGIADPFFRVHDGVAGAETIIAGKRYANFASYNYVGLNGHPEIAVAAKAAIDRWGTSVSASRPVSGERTVHRDLERALARLHRAEDSVALVGGHSTNVTLIGHLLGRDDVIVHDALIHNSVVEGARLSGARRVPFPHLDHEAADRRLAEARPRGGHALLVIEGHYSMDGDVPDLPAFIAVARRHRAWLMVDEAHALGGSGRARFWHCRLFRCRSGRGRHLDGTISKSLVACGGYIAGRAELIDYLKLVLPGFVFSVGMAPPTAAAALAALAILEREPGRVRRLNDRAALFLKLAREGGLDVGGSSVRHRAGHHRRLNSRRSVGASNVRPRRQCPADPLPRRPRACGAAAVLPDRRTQRGAGPRGGANSTGREPPDRLGADRFRCRHPPSRPAGVADGLTPAGAAARSAISASTAAK